MPFLFTLHINQTGGGGHGKQRLECSQTVEPNPSNFSQNNLNWPTFLPFINLHAKNRENGARKPGPLSNYLLVSNGYGNGADLLLNKQAIDLSCVCLIFYFSGR